MAFRIETKARKIMGQSITIGLLLFTSLVFQPLAYGAGESEPKMLSGISVVGNNEAPKSLFIVSWKGSEIGSETDLTSGLMDDSMRPVDRDVFMREIDFYDIRQGR
ncbi:MAG: hypothetical protein ABFS08_02045 [Pseudomonadota bacterium]